MNLDAFLGSRFVLAGQRRWAVVECDNLEFLRDLPAGCAHLIYLDPPFCTGREFHLPDKTLAFVDRWRSIDEYLSWLGARVVAAFATLAREGSLVVHIDPRTSHHVKVMLDGVLGPERFRSEIIWRYRRMPSGVGNFERVHDVLLRYVRAPGHERWTQLFEPLAPSTLAKFGVKRQRKGAFRGTGEEESPGAPLGDVWDIGVLGPRSSERTGYPTQKPEALIKRLVLACTLPGDVVIDPTCGSGTTIAVAERLGRRAIGCDSGAAAIRIARQRLERQTAQAGLPGVKGALE